MTTKKSEFRINAESPEHPIMDIGVSTSKSYQQSIGRRLMDADFTARYLGISKKTLYNRVHPKSKNPLGLKPKRIGRKLLFDSRDLEAYVDSIK